MDARVLILAVVDVVDAGDDVVVVGSFARVGEEEARTRDGVLEVDAGVVVTVGVGDTRDRHRARDVDRGDDEVEAPRIHDGAGDALQAVGEVSGVALAGRLVVYNDAAAVARAVDASAGSGVAVAISGVAVAISGVAVAISGVASGLAAARAAAK